MAKKATKEPITSINILDPIDKQLISEFGDGVFVNGNSIIDRKRILIPVTPTLDLVLGGGIKEGSLVIITGSYKTGKTSVCLDFAGTAQQPEYKPQNGNRHVYFFNIEGRLEQRDLKGIPHLLTDPLHFTVVESHQGKILTAEEFIKIAEILIKTRPYSVFIIDSFSQLCTAGEMSAEIGDRYRADAPLLLARFTRRIANVLKVNNSILLGVTHQIANQGTGMSKWSEASGQKIQYQSDIKLRATHFTPYMGGTDTQIGQEIHLVCTWSNSGAPGGKHTTLLRYGSGLDKCYDLVSLASELNIICKKGSWYSYNEENIGQGKENSSNFLRNNPTIYNDINNQVRDMMGLSSVG